MPTENLHYIQTRAPTDRDNARLWTRNDCVTQLAAIEFDSFAQIWNVAGDLEPLAPARGGWTSAGRFQQGATGHELLIRRQQNQMRRSWSVPFGAPTYRFEFQICQRLADLSLCPRPMLYGERDGELGTEAILISEPLNPRFTPMDQLLAQAPDGLVPLVGRLGRELAEMHRQGVQNGALTGSNIFIDRESGDARLGNWENARWCRRATTAALADFKHWLSHDERPNRELAAALLDGYSGDLEAARRRILRLF